MAEPTPPRVDPSVPERLTDVAGRLRDGRSTTRAQLESLVRIPSVSAPGHDPGHCRRSAEATAELLEDAGLAEVSLLELDPGAPAGRHTTVHPYAYGQWLQAGGDAPTVLLYAHHDVQPVGTPDGWSTPPFEPTERDGRLYGRGAADDKAGVMVHVAALRAWLRERGSAPVNVKVIVEGEEEIGSPHLDRFLATHGERLAADVIVLTDLTNWKVGWPGLTYTLRGMGECFVTVRALETPVHSGMYGGPVPDALTGMVRLLATLHDAAGRIAVAGFADDVDEPGADRLARLRALEPGPDQLRAEAGLRDGVELVGDPDHGLLERLWLRPTITPTGMDVPDLPQASNTLLSSVTARLSCRFAPGQDPDRALGALRDHLHAHAPWGLQVDVDLGERNAAWTTDPSGPAWEAAVAAMTSAFGRAPAALGCGGSIPFVAPFSRSFGGAACLLTGIEDPHTNAHGDDESLHLGDFHRACLAEVLLLAELAERGAELTGSG